MPVCLYIRATVKLHICGILSILQSLALATELHKVPDNLKSFTLFYFWKTDCAAVSYTHKLSAISKTFFFPQSICCSSSTVNVVKTLLKQQTKPTVLVVISISTFLYRPLFSKAPCARFSTWDVSQGWIQQDGNLVPDEKTNPLGASQISHSGIYMAKYILF